MTKLERWERGFNEAATRAGRGCATLVPGGPGHTHTRPHLHVYGVAEDCAFVLCIDDGTMGFHPIGACPFLTG